MTGQIAHKADKAPIQAGERWHVERTHAWHSAFNRPQRRYERRGEVIGAFFDLDDAIITVRSLIRQAWTTYRRGTTSAHRRRSPHPSASSKYGPLCRAPDDPGEGLALT